MMTGGNINGCGKMMRKKKKGEEKGFSLILLLSISLSSLFFSFYFLTSLLFPYILGPRGAGSVILFEME